MDYTEIKTITLSYADRSDADVTSRMDDFLRIVESRINRRLKTLEMSVRARISAVADQEYYGLPTGFAGLRQIKHVSGTDKVTGSPMNPEQIDSLSGKSGLVGLFYNINDSQIQIYPTKDSGEFELLYYKKVTALDGTNTTNWVSEGAPDCYIFGLLVEISAFIKDAEAKAIWDNRFLEVVEELKSDDLETRWSGPSMVTRAG